MKPGSKKLTLMLFAAILILTLIQLPFAPSASAIGTGTNYIMPGTAMTFTDTDPPGWTAPGTTPVGRDIVTAYYNYDIVDSSLHLQVNLSGAAATTNWTNGDRMAIFIDYKTGGSPGGFDLNTGAPAGLTDMDYYLELKHGSGGWANPLIQYWKLDANPDPKWANVPNNAFKPKWFASGDHSTSLQWKIPLGGLNPTAIFDFYVVTYPEGSNGNALFFDGYTGTTTDISPKFHTPIPSAAWLLGSGIIGLIGLKRKRARMV